MFFVCCIKERIWWSTTALFVLLCCDIVMQVEVEAFLRAHFTKHGHHYSMFQIKKDKKKYFKAKCLKFLFSNPHTKKFKLHGALSQITRVEKIIGTSCARTTRRGIKKSTQIFKSRWQVHSMLFFDAWKRWWLRWWRYSHAIVSHSSFIHATLYEKVKWGSTQKQSKFNIKCVITRK